MRYSPSLLLHRLSTSKRSFLNQGVFLFALVVTLSPALAAQEATIVGTVTDQTGALMTAVTVSVANSQTGARRTESTNKVGQYVVFGLPIGIYDVKAESAGFEVQESQGVVLNVNARVRVDFRMKIGTKTEPVLVESTPIQVQADSGEQGSLVSGTQISELSANGRSIYTYITLTPGAANLMPSFQPPTAASANSNVSFNGNRQGHNLYLLDGGENDDRGGAGSSIMPSIDAIAETETLTSNCSADYGLSSGGTISSVLKSGTKGFHSSLWEFFRNDALDARNHFNLAPAPVAELRYNLFGFNVGGPVTFGQLYNASRTKTFFFYNMEWRDLIQGQILNQTVPFASEYPDASGPGTGAILPATFGGEASIATVPTGVAGLGAGCSAAVAATLVPGQPFPNNTIPDCMINQNAKSLLFAGGKYGGIFPQPTNPQGQFIGGNNLPTNVREEIVRIDHHIGEKLLIFGHLVAEQISQSFGTDIFSPDNVPSVGTDFPNPSYAAVIHSTDVISPTLVNEASFNYNGNRVTLLPVGLVTAPSDFVFNRYFHGPNTQNRIPSILLVGSTGARYSSGITPWHNFGRSYQIRDDVSWTRGRHQLRMGGSWMFFEKVQDWGQATQGGFVFTGLYTGNDFADYLLGYTTSYTEAAIQSTGHWNSVSSATYFQDNWRTTSQLTLNLGLRWDGIPHTYEANKQMSNFYPHLYEPANAAQLSGNYQTILPTSPGLGIGPNPILANTPLYLNGVGICGTHGLPGGCVNGAWLNFGPRLGFAYSLTPSGKTVLRGGYGIMYERLQGNDTYNTAANSPFSAGVNFHLVSLSNPSTSIPTGSTLQASIPVSSLVGLEQNKYAAPRSSQFSLGIQQAMGKTVLSVAYVGTQNRHQNFYAETNLPPQNLLPGFVTNIALAQTYNSSVPYVGYNSVLMSQDEANADYNSIQISLRGTTFKNDLNFQAGYTYSHTNDSFDGITASAGDLYNISDPYQGWKYDFGPSAFDIRNNFFTNLVYRIPLLNNSQNPALKMILGGWELSGIITAISGAPLDIGLAVPNVVNIVPNTANRPNINGRMADPHTVGKWFDTSVFSAPAPGTWGNEPHNGVRGPGRDNWNISLFKNFLIDEKRGTNLQFRGEFFNLWNHPQWVGDTQNGGISTQFGASDFGAITSAYDARTIQLALKFSF